MTKNRSGRAAALTPRLIALISDLEAYEALEKGKRPGDSYLYQISAAMRVGVHEPFTKEQEALNAFLSRIGAGKELTNKAWQLYTEDIKKSA